MRNNVTKLMETTDFRVTVRASQHIFDSNDSMAKNLAANKHKGEKVRNYLFMTDAGTALLSKVERSAQRQLSIDGYVYQEYSQYLEDIAAEFSAMVWEFLVTYGKDDKKIYGRESGQGGFVRYTTVEALPFAVLWFRLKNIYRTAFRRVLRNKSTCVLLNRYSFVQSDSLDRTFSDGEGHEQAIIDTLEGIADRYDFGTFDEVLENFRTALSPAQYRSVLKLLETDGNTKALDRNEQKNASKARKILAEQTFFQRMSIDDKLDFIYELEHSRKDLLTTLQAL
jgi:hypothetical protein